MGEYDIANAVVSDMTTAVTDYSVSPISTDGPGEQDETRYYNTNWNQYYTYYKKNIGGYRNAINAFATWVLGKGWKADPATTATLDNITGCGEDSILAILWNQVVVKKVNGASFAHIIRNPDSGILINLKPLDPASMVTVIGPDGVILRYEQISKVKGKKPKEFKTQEILHMINDRVADGIIGVSVTEGVEWALLAREEAVTDQKKVMHRNVVPVRIIEVETQNTTKIAQLKTQYEEAIKKGEVLIIPKGTVEVKDTKAMLQDILPWIRYLDDVILRQVGVPRIITGGTSETEGDAKVSYLVYEQVYTREVEELKADLWNQMAIRLEFSPPVSLKEKEQQDEIKNTSQTGFQPNDTTAGRGE